MSVRNTCKGVIRATLRRTWELRPPSRESRVIYYHSVHPSLPLGMPPSLFEQHIVAAKKLNYRFITHREIPEAVAQVNADPWIALGFDDGYEDNFEFARPILDRHDIRATFFVVAGQIRQKNEYPESGYQFYSNRRMMSRNQLKGLASSGHEIASHGLQHELATAVIADGRDLASDYSKSREMLSDWSGEDVKSYSYPNGQNGAFDSRTRAATIAAGFQTAAVTVWGTVGKDVDLHTLPRCEVAAEDTADHLVRKLTGKEDYMRLAHRLRRSPTWQR